jgi:hypothetical protein
MEPTGSLTFISPRIDPALSLVNTLKLKIDEARSPETSVSYHNPDDSD